MVEKFQSSSGPVNTASALINYVSDTYVQHLRRVNPLTILFLYRPHFVRFLHLQGGQGLLHLVVKRIIGPEDFRAGLDEEEIAETCQFLSTFLVIQGQESINEEDKRKLMEKLNRWHDLFSDKFAGSTADRCIGILTGDRTLQLQAMLVKEMLQSPLKKCGAPDCKNENATMLCSRCKAAAYCNVSHQKAAWSSHKRLCFPCVF
ncbi:hypothetical protein AX15_002454 [Amanita polypyramis BW_CC]|nr:hypothetical protein AX15_002454 [Amanita polypyramis BW_CC]